MNFMKAAPTGTRPSTAIIRKGPAIFIVQSAGRSAVETVAGFAVVSSTSTPS